MTVEDLLRENLREQAAQAHAGPPFEQVARRARQLRRRRRTVAALVAAGTLAAAAAGSALVGQGQDEPPRSTALAFRLPAQVTGPPYRAQLLVTLAEPNETYAVQADTGLIYRVPQLSAGTQLRSLSADGTRVVEQAQDCGNPSYIELPTGERSPIPSVRGCALPSTDGTRVADLYAGASRVQIVDLRTDEATNVPYTAPRREPLPARAMGGWSPDGDVLAIAAGPTRLNFLSLRTGQLTTLRYYGLVNGGMSWSPDGQWVIVLSRDGTGYETVNPEGPHRPLRTPDPDARPLGWAGDRVVWLTGPVGAQRLVTTDAAGRGRRAWVRFEVGDRPVTDAAWPASAPPTFLPR